MSDDQDKPDKPKIILNISQGGIPLERVSFNTPALCPNCQKRVSEREVFCYNCWTVIEGRK